MRYRSFGNSGKAVSAIGLLLRNPNLAPTPQASRDLFFAAMENGINCFEVAAGSEAFERGVFEALAAVERRLIFLIWRIKDDGQPLTAQRIAQIVRHGLQRTGAGYFDLLMLEEEAVAALTPDGRDFLASLKSGGAALQIGASGDGPAVDGCIGVAPFDVLSTPFNLTSDWKTRRRVKEGAEAGMTAIAYDPAPEAMAQLAGANPGAPRGPSLLNRLRASSVAAAPTGAYAFLHETPRWTPEELCLAYALTEPSFSTVQIETASPEALERLCAVGERELPTGMAAQIEMARFSAEPRAEQKRA